MLKFSNLLKESRKTEEVGMNLLKKNNIEEPESIIKRFAEGDKSNNQKNIPFMSFIYLKYNDIDSIISVFNEYNELEEKKRIKPLQFSKGSLFIGDKQIEGFIDFANYVHGIQSKYTTKEKGSSYKMDNEDVIAMDKPMWSGNGFDIYDANSPDKCIKYRNGGLTGKSYTFCIGAYGPSNLYQSYRDNTDSTFYFIVDKNKISTDEDGSVNLDDPLHMVVYDVQRGGRISLTDAKNTTGSISEFNSNTQGYVDYLKSNGVPVEKLVNRPKTEKENEEEKLLKHKNNDLQWFINLPMEYKSRYIGRGHELTDEQFDYLIGN
jgi:hypothetical protein